MASRPQRTARSVVFVARTLHGRLRRAGDRLEQELAAYAGIHFREGGRALMQLRRAGRGRSELLAALFATAVLGLALVHADGG